MTNNCKLLPASAVMAGTLCLFLLPYLMVLSFPAQFGATFDKHYYLVFHNAAEFFSIMVSLCVFSVGWFTYEQSRDQRALFFGVAFLAVGLLDFMHAMSNLAMPPFITPNSPNKSTQFWIAARLLDASAFLVSGFLVHEKVRSSLGKKTALSAAFALLGAIFTAVIFFPDSLPPTAVEGRGLTDLKRYLELVVIVLLASSWLVYWRRFQQTRDRNLLYFLRAFIVCICSEAVFASYFQSFDTLNVLGHVYKVVAFYLIYQGIFIGSVRKPYLHLSAANQELTRLNRLYTVLSETNKEIARADDRKALLQGICCVAVKHGGFLMAWAGVLQEQTGRVEPVACSGLDSGFLEAVSDKLCRGADAELSGITAGLQICGDIMKDPRTLPWRSEAISRGYRSCAVIALKVGKRPIGALTIYAAEEEFFGSQLADLLSQLGSDISFALEFLDGDARRREVERALKEETLARLRVMEALHEKDQMLMQQSRLAAMGEMINNIAHQWRQPLNVIGLIVQELQLKYAAGGLKQGFFEKKNADLMDLIQHMSQTIEDFRTFFKPNKQKESFLVREVVARTLSLVQGSYHNLQIDLELALPGDAVVYGYRNEYSQVLLNILINAKDAFSARPPDGPRRVSISSCTENGRTVLTVSDNAGGIPEQIIHKVFDPYFTTKGPDQGTGLGLYMSKSIIDKSMNGRLTVRNTAQGAEFRIEVPEAEMSDFAEFDSAVGV